MKVNIKIACLPVAGIGNPYQYLMLEGLNKEPRINAVGGHENKIFGIIITYLKNKPDYLHFDWIVSYYYRKNIFFTLLSTLLFVLQILFIQIFTKTKIVWTLHNILPHDLQRKWIHVFCQKFLAKRATFIRVFYSGTILRANNYLKTDKSKFIIVPEGSYVNYYKNNCSEIEAKKVLGINKAYMKIYLFLGLIKPYKGILDFVKMYNLNANKDCLLVIAGKSMDKIYFEKIKNECFGKENIILNEGFVSPDNLQYYYKASDIVVLPFENIENSGSVIMAMGFKKPIIAPLQAVLQERLKFQNELLFVNDIKSVFLKSLNFENEQLKSIGRNNYNQLLTYSWTDFAKYFV